MKVANENFTSQDREETMIAKRFDSYTAVIISGSYKGRWDACLNTVGCPKGGKKVTGDDDCYNRESNYLNCNPKFISVNLINTKRIVWVVGGGRMGQYSSTGWK